jgi:hypothetical protein
MTVSCSDLRSTSRSRATLSNVRLRLDVVSKASALLIPLAGLSSASFARGDERLDRASCVEAYVAAQNARKASHLLEAAQGLTRCARDECPGMIKRDCSQWLDEVSRALPSLVLSVRDDRGRDILGAQVFVDERPVPIDGRLLPVDPGKHAVRVRLLDGAQHDEVVVVAVGEKERAVTIVVPSSPRVASRARIPIASFVLGGVAVVGLGVGMYFGIRGAADRASYGCAMGCSPTNYAIVSREFDAADIALGVGVAAAAAALAWWLFAPKHAAPSADLAWAVMR